MAKEKNDTVPTDEELAGRIYTVRGQRVMLDRGLAALYGVKPIRLREQVKRNLAKFPPHFMFRLTEDEAALMVSQNAIPSIGHLGGTLPYAFTEHGALQLANVLRSERATQTGIRIIEVFVKMRGALLAHKDILLKLEQLERRTEGHGEDIEVIFSALKRLLDPEREPRRRIGFRSGEGRGG